MTNKVKPFYIRITDDMTPQMVQDAFDKCVDAGAVANDCIENTAKKNCGWCYFGSIHDWKVFGVVESKGTWLGDDPRFMYSNAQEITIDQLDEWLWLEVDQEWKNGDECIYKGNGAVVIGWHPGHPIVIIDSDELGLESCSPCELSKPETPEQKAERERLENGKSLYELVQSIWCTVDSKYTPHPYESPMVCDNTKELYARLAKAVNYRKQ